MTELPLLTVILGAGASYDVWNGTSPVKHAKWRPPLARDLFPAVDISKPRNHVEHERLGAYWDIVNGYPGVRVLQSTLGGIGTPALPLEQKLRDLANHADERVRRMFFQVPPYLRDLLVKCSNEYVGYTGSYSELLLALLSTFPHQVMFVSLNYDNLLEWALREYGIQLDSMPDYICDPQVAVVKPHGSVEWGLRCDNLHRQSISGTSNFEIGDITNTRFPLMVQRSPVMTPQWSSGSNEPLYPLLTAPLAGKTRELSIVCPPSHSEFLRDFLRRCKKYLIIGCSGMDSDLLEIMDEAIDEVAFVHYVSGSKDMAQSSLTAFSNSVRPFHRGRQSASEANGFASFLRKNELGSLLGN